MYVLVLVFLVDTWGSDGHEEGIEGVDLGCGLIRVGVWVGSIISQTHWGGALLELYTSRLLKITLVACTSLLRKSGCVSETS